MAYLAPHFVTDVFVSYSHGDPHGKRDAPLKRWTLALVEKLQDQIFSLDTEFDAIHIWLDPLIDPTLGLTPELRKTVGSAAILLIVMSKRYLVSSWCGDEAKWFGGEIADRAALQGRYFVLRAQPTEESAWPAFLRDERGHALTGFTFYDPKDLDGTPYGWPDFADTGAAFNRELRRLETTLTRRLREMRDRGEKRAAVAEAVALPTAVGPRRIYLHALADHQSQRDSIGQMLLADGIAPLTAQMNAGSDLASWQKDSAIRIETAKRCQALALLRVEADERFVGDLMDIGIDEREKIRAARGTPLPCAVLDSTGQTLPIDVSPYGIERFDLTNDSWRGKFSDWLTRSQVQTGVAP